MLNSKERLNEIKQYLLLYENLIVLSNKAGLFDEAKLFENFALKICEILFNKKFVNKNEEKTNFPYIDLTSSDDEIHVQVTTVKELPTKINSTLNNISNSKEEYFKNIKNIKFVTLHNESVDRVREKIVEGKIIFNKKDDLITTRTILNKAISNPDFQLELYKLIMEDKKWLEDNVDKINSTIYRSKKIDLEYITSTISGDYEIPRNEYVTRVSSSTKKFINLIGEAGIGKSVIAKRVLFDKEHVIYARAESFLESNHLDDIWGFNVRKSFSLIKEPLYIFIDALEFISDNLNKIKLLHELYDVVEKHDNIKIISTCRTGDYKSFDKLFSNREVLNIEVKKLSHKELNIISDTFPILKTFLKGSEYKKMVSNPFYLDVLISNKQDMSNINNEDSLRRHIWNEVICLKRKSKSFGLKYNDITMTIYDIVFDRAKNFLLGSNVDEYDSDIIKALLSEEVLVQRGNHVRLKYDVFEDITFEQHFDKLFINSKGNLDDFFAEINEFGRTAYRRYQIWVSNKLITKANRENFLYKIIFSLNVSKTWREQTQIGLVKSMYYEDFFIEYFDDLVNKNILNDFINIINLYAFEFDYSTIHNLMGLINLKPVGMGRKSLIKLIYENEMYLNDNVDHKKVKKMCVDYSKTKKTQHDVALATSRILEHYFYKDIFQDNIRFTTNYENILSSIYELSEHSKQWINELWEILFDNLKSGKRTVDASKIINYTLKIKHVALLKNMKNETMDLVKRYWTLKLEKNNKYLSYTQLETDNYRLWGLNKYAREYDFNYRNYKPELSNIYYLLLKIDYWYALDWLIDFLNMLSLEYMKGKNKIKENIDLYFVEKQSIKNYFGSEEMWLLGLDENNSPMLLNDLIYLFREELILILRNKEKGSEIKKKILTETKNRIDFNSNNIILMSVITDVAKIFINDYPGIAIDLVTDLNILNYDLRKTVSLTSNPYKEEILKNIFKTMGVPYTKRYKISSNIGMDIRQYMLYSQIYFGEEIKKKSLTIVDYLYDLTKENINNAQLQFHIQSMDSRLLKYEKTIDDYHVFLPELSGKAKKMNEETIKSSSEFADINNQIEKLNELEVGEEINVEDIVKVIEDIDDIPNSNVNKIMYSKIRIDLIIIALSKKDLPQVYRKKYVLKWIADINGCFKNQHCEFSDKHIILLFNQINENVETKIKNQIYKIILELILYNESHGIILSMKRSAKAFLKTKPKLSKRLFNTIILLSKETISKYKFNWECINPGNEDEKIEFIPNVHPNLELQKGVDYFCKDVYKIDVETIIIKYLYEGKPLSIPTFDTKDYEINMLFHSFGLIENLFDDSYNDILDKVIKELINIYTLEENIYYKKNKFDFYSLYELTDFLRNKLIKNIKVAEFILNLLFVGIDFNKFNKDCFKFYDEILSVLLVAFFDSHQDYKQREEIKHIILLLEKHISNIENQKVRERLFKHLILAPQKQYISLDWTKLKSKYSLRDKKFLNTMFSEYAYFHLDEFIQVVLKLNHTKLLPEIILPMKETFEKAKLHYKSSINYFDNFLRDNKQSILKIIYDAYFNFSDEIKSDETYTTSFEYLNHLMIDLGYEEFAVILDNFRIY